MPTSQSKTELLNDLRMLHGDMLSCAEFRKKYFKNPAIDWRDFPDVLANLDHFLSDEDIRAKDASYKKMQIDELGKLIRLLEEDASNDELKKIHFLGKS